MAKGSLSGYQWTFLYSLEKAYALKMSIKYMQFPRDYFENIKPCWHTVKTFPKYSRSLSSNRNSKMEQPKLLQKQTHLSLFLEAAHPTDATLCLDGILHCKTAKHLCYICKRCLHDRHFLSISSHRPPEKPELFWHMKARQDTTYHLQDSCFSASASCISCTLTCCSRMQFPPLSCMGALRAQIQSHGLDASSLLTPQWKVKATQAMPLTQINSSAKYCQIHRMPAV